MNKVLALVASLLLTTSAFAADTAPAATDAKKTDAATTEAPAADAAPADADAAKK